GVDILSSSHAVQLRGGYGYMREYPVEGFFRDVRLWTIASGSSEMVREIIARRLPLPSSQRAGRTTTGCPGRAPPPTGDDTAHGSGRERRHGMTKRNALWVAT